jgi:hypothetical protein
MAVEAETHIKKLRLTQKLWAEIGAEHYLPNLHVIFGACKC